MHDDFIIAKFTKFLQSIIDFQYRLETTITINYLQTIIERKLLKNIEKTGIWNPASSLHVDIAFQRTHFKFRASLLELTSPMTASLQFRSICFARVTRHLQFFGSIMSMRNQTSIKDDPEAFGEEVVSDTKTNFLTLHSKLYQMRRIYFAFAKLPN